MADEQTPTPAPTIPGMADDVERVLAKQSEPGGLYHLRPDLVAKVRGVLYAGRSAGALEPEVDRSPQAEAARMHEANWQVEQNERITHRAVAGHLETLVNVPEAQLAQRAEALKQQLGAGYAEMKADVDAQLRLINGGADLKRLVEADPYAFKMLASMGQYRRFAEARRPK